MVGEGGLGKRNGVWTMRIDREVILGSGRHLGTSWTSVLSRTGCGPVQSTGLHEGITKPVRCWGWGPVGAPPNGPVGFPVLLGVRRENESVRFGIGTGLNGGGL